MSIEHFTQMFPAACAGLGLFLAGAANLLLLRRGLVVRVAATLSAGGVAVGAAWALNQPGIVTDTAAYFAVGLVPCLLLASRRLVTGAAAALSATNRPVVRFGLLAAAGIGTIVGSIALFERSEERATEAAMAEMELAQGIVPSAPSPRAKAVTDKGSSITVKEPTAVEGQERLSAAEERVLLNAGLHNQVMRRGPSDSRSNCHGWVFTGGKFLVSGEDVDVILHENGYQEVTDPRLGDVVVYRQGSAVAHTAVVRYVTEGQPVLVESKWGTLGIFLHPVDKSVYGTEYTFHRSPRTGHLLAGLDVPVTATE